MPWTGPWEACVSCTDVLVEASSYSSSSSRPALGSHVFAMSFTPLGAWVPSRIPDPAGSLSCPAQGPSCLPAVPLRLSGPLLCRVPSFTCRNGAWAQSPALVLEQKSWVLSTFG